MKSAVFFSNFARAIFLFSLMIFQTAIVFSQSGQSKENQPQNQTIETDGKDQNEDSSELEPYEYVEPASIENFIKKLNELGAKKYRLRDLTQIPVGFTKEFRDNKDATKLTIQLAGVARLDEAKYEYRMLAVEDTNDLARTLNGESKEGFNPREVIVYSNTLEISGTADDSISASLQVLASMPRLNSLILLEREVEKYHAPRNFQILIAGYGIGKKPTEKMNLLLAEASKKSFYPIALFARQDFGGKTQKDDKLKIIDFYYAVIAQEMNEDAPVELEFVRSQTWNDFNKRVNKLAGRGFRIGDSGFIYGLMTKEREDTPPLKNYQWINTKSKSLAAQLDAFSKAGARLSGTGMYVGEVELEDVFVNAIFENRLIFETPEKDATTRYEYELLPMIAERAQINLIGKTAVPGDAPMQKFKRILKQGFQFTNLIYANKKVTAIFERQRAN